MLLANFVRMWLSWLSLSLLTSNEKGVPSEDDLLLAVLHVPADAVLSMARRMQGLDGDIVPYLEGLAMSRRPRDGFTVLAANDGEAWKLR